MTCRDQRIRVEEADCLDRPTRLVLAFGRPRVGKVHQDEHSLRRSASDESELGLNRHGCNAAPNMKSRQRGLRRASRLGQDRYVPVRTSCHERPVLFTVLNCGYFARMHFVLLQHAAAVVC